MVGEELNEPVFPPLAGPSRAGKADALAGDKFRAATPAAAAAAAVGEGVAEDGTASDGDSDICARAAAASLAALDGDSDGVASVSGDARPSALAPETTPLGCIRTMGACDGDSGIGMLKLPAVDGGGGGGDAFDCARTCASCRCGAIVTALIVATEVADASGAKNKRQSHPGVHSGAGGATSCRADECVGCGFAPVASCTLLVRAAAAAAAAAAACAAQRDDRMTSEATKRAVSALWIRRIGWQVGWVG